MSADSRLISEVSYRLLVEGIVDVAIFMLEPDGTIASWNAGAQRIKGYAEAEIVGRHITAFYTAGDVARGEPMRTLSIARATGKFEGEGWRVRKDGTRFWASVVVDPLTDDDGNLIGFAKVTRDVTERSIKEEQRQIIVDAAPNGMLIVDDAGTITLANAQAERIFGYRSGAITGLPLERLLSGNAIERPIYRNALPKLDATSTLSEQCAREELTGRRRDGSAFLVEVTFNATPTARGLVIVASVSDITERRAAALERDRFEVALMQANRLMAMAEEMAHYGHWRIDLASKDVYWSPEVYRTHGRPLSYVPTIETGIAAYGPLGADVSDTIRRAAADGEPFSFESRILRPDGAFRDVRCSGRAERDVDGTIVALVGIFQDITEKKEAAREREQLIERVTRATHAGMVAIWEWGVSAQTMAWDANMFALYGYDRNSVTPSYELWRDSLAADDRERAVHDIDAAIRGERPFDTEFRIKRPAGDIRSIRAQGTVVRDAAGEPVRMVGINWDVTEVRGLADQLGKDKERALALERERLYEHERKWSTTFQRAVLPLALPKVPGCTFDAVYEPGLSDAQVGGDWYDAVHLIDGRILVSIGDVSGNGLEAAVVVGVVRQIMRGISQLHANPTLILDAADRALCLEYPGIYVSAWVGLIDLVTRTITYASAGHPPPLMVTREGEVRELEDATTMLIGLREGHRGASTSVGIARGDTLVLYTDGVTEARRDIIAGNASLREAVGMLATSTYRHPADTVKRYVIPDGSLDDVAILVVRTDYAEAERYVERWQFPIRDHNAATAVRNKFIDALDEQGFTFDERANAELVFGELIGNVVRHASQTDEVEIALDRGGAYTVLHVLDRGNGFHHISRLPPDPFAETGRGLFLIAALSVDFTVSERPDGGSHARTVLRGQRTGSRRVATSPA